MSYQDRGNGRDFNRNERGQRGGRPQRGNGNEDQAPRGPLQWKTERTFQKGRIVLVLQSAELDRGGKRWSFRVGKESQDNPDKPFPFMDPRDMGAVQEVLAEMEAHLATVRASGLED